MPDPQSTEEAIRRAFASTRFPGNQNLRESNEGDEPFLLEQDFQGKTDWRALDPVFIDRAPDGYGSALSFFSDEAFRFYLPAYLIADLKGLLEQHDPVFHLTHGLTDDGKRKHVNPRRYGDKTWYEVATQKFSLFDNEQREAIRQYLQLKRESDEFQRDVIDQALANYWSHGEA